MNKKILSLLLIFSGGFACADETVVAQGNALYQKVGDLVLKSEDYIVKPSNVTPEENKKTELAKLKERAEKFLATLSPVRQKELVFNLFSKSGALTSAEKSLEDYSLQELNLIIGSDLSRKMSLYQAIDRTETIAGSAVLSTMLSTPVSDISVIKKRQGLIEFLLKNEDLFNHLNSFVKDVKDGQNSLFNCWNSEAALDEGLRKLFYMPKNLITSYVNKSPAHHQFNRIMLLCGVATNCVGVPFGICVALSFATMGVYNAPNMGEKVGIGLVATMYSACMAYALKMILDQFKLVNSVVFNMHKRLRDISKIIQSFDNICVSIRDYQELYEGLSLADNMTNFALDPKSISHDLDYLKNLLNQRVFEKEKFGLFSHAGNVLAAYEYADEIKDALSLPLEAVGELDAYLSIVKLIKEHKNKPSGFCFVDFVEQDSPLIQLQGVWSTLVGAEQAKPANITLGGEGNPNNANFTGPNGSGKSILMKAVVSCDILGRTFGIAPAKKAKMTLFKKIYTYVNVKEDPKLGQSLFMAERARGEDILNKLAMNPNEKVIIIIDEPYNGTIADSSETLTYDLVDQIGKYPHAVCLLATHRRKPAELADEKPEQFANYHFKITEDKPNEFERTFMLTSGKCDWWYSDAARRDRYIKLFH